MNFKYLLPIVALILGLAGAGCNKAGKLREQSTYKTPTGPVLLKVKWPQGERVVQDTDMKINNEITVPGQPNPMQQNMTMGQKYALTVLKENPDSTHEVQLEFLNTTMGMDMAGKSMLKYDSSKNSAADGTDPLIATFGKIIGSKITYFLDASNNVDHIEGVQDLLNRLSAGGNAQAMAPVKTMFSDGYFKQLMSSSQFLPPNPVAPGDSWQVSMEFPMPAIGTLVLNYTVTLQGWEMHGARNCARLEFDGTIQTKPDAGGSPDPSLMGVTMAIKDGTTSGTSWFDPEFGIIIDTRLNQDMTINIAVPANPKIKQGPGSQPQNVTSKMSQVLHIQLDSVK
jgi:hypothetical protein